MNSVHRYPNPSNIIYHQTSKVLSLEFDDSQKFDLPCEFLRVFTPSAEARGHGPGQEVLQVGKRDVSIQRIEPVGNYAICLIFSDGHDSGIYSWDMLYEFGRHHDELWQAYLEKLAAAGASRDTAVSPTAPAVTRACGAGGCNK